MLKLETTQVVATSVSRAHDNASPLYTTKSKRKMQASFLDNLSISDIKQCCQTVDRRSLNPLLSNFYNSATMTVKRCLLSTGARYTKLRKKLTN